jgi:DNA-binding transcriptional MerR regulator
MMMRGPVKLIGIGELSELAGVTPRALRYYEAEGLIEARRDRYNVRCYDWGSRRRLLLLVQLRRAGLSLSEVRSILATQDAGEPVRDHARERISARLTALEHERERAHAVLQMLEELEPALAQAG